MPQYHEMNEQALVALVANGDELAFKHLYRLLLPHLAGTGIKILRSREAVSEVIQECLLRVWMNRQKLHGVRHPRAWIFRIYSNECFRYLRKNGLQFLSIETLQESELSFSHNNAERAYAMRETQQLIYKAVTSLSPRQREIYTLSRERGLKISEIAAHLGLTSKYVKKTLIVALHSIRQRLLEAGKSLTALILFISLFHR